MHITYSLLVGWLRRDFIFGLFCIEYQLGGTESIQFTEHRSTQFIEHRNLQFTVYRLQYRLHKFKMKKQHYNRLLSIPFYMYAHNELYKFRTLCMHTMLNTLLSNPVWLQKTLGHPVSTQKLYKSRQPFMHRRNCTNLGHTVWTHMLSQICAHLTNIGHPICTTGEKFRPSCKHKMDCTNVGHPVCTWGIVQM